MSRRPGAIRGEANRLSLRKIKKQLKQFRLELVVGTEINHIRIADRVSLKCVRKGHIFEDSLAHQVYDNRRGCPECRKLLQFDQRQAAELKHIDKILRARGFERESNEYVNQNTSVKYRCKTTGLSYSKPAAEIKVGKLTTKSHEGYRKACILCIKLGYEMRTPPEKIEGPDTKVTITNGIKTYSKALKNIARMLRRMASHNSSNCRTVEMQNIELPFTVYSILTNAQQRCTNRNDPRYKTYGQRKIGIDDRYSISFQAKNFNGLGTGWNAVRNLLEDIGYPPNNDFDVYQLHRIDNDKGYIPGNLEWATKKTQANVKTNSVILLLHGEPISGEDAAELYGVKRETITSWVRKSGDNELSNITSGRGRSYIDIIYNNYYIVLHLIESGRYFITSDGAHVYSIKGNGITEVVPHVYPGGYIGVKLSFNGKSINYPVSRLCATQWLENTDPKLNILESPIGDL